MNLSRSFAGSHRSLVAPLPAADLSSAFTPSVIVGPARRVPQPAPQIEFGTLKAGAFGPFTLARSICAFNGTVQVGS